MARVMNMRGGRNMRGGPRGKAKKGTLPRLLKMLFATSKGSMAIVFLCITISAITGVASSLFLKQLLTNIKIGLGGEVAKAWEGLITLFVTMGAVYFTSILCIYFILHN